MMRTTLFASFALAWAALIVASPVHAVLAPADLVAYYPFDGSGADSSGNGYNVSIVDASTAASSFTGTGKFAQAFDTDTDGGAFTAPGGKSDIAQDLADNDGPKMLGDDSYTLTGWFKFNAIGGQAETQNTIFFDTSNLGNIYQGYDIRMTAGLSAFGGPNQAQTFSFRSGDANGSEDDTGDGAVIFLNNFEGNGTPPWQSNLWYFFAGRMGNSAPGGLKIFLIPETSTFAGAMGSIGDGIAPSAELVPSADDALTIGRAGVNGSMDGLRDDFAIWNRALADEELQGLFEGGLNGMSVGQLISPDSLAGDYNNNGKVDAADYVTWRNAGPTDTLPNDPTPGTVDGTDYTTWRANFGKPPGSGSALGGGRAVPEPSVVVLFVSGAVGALMLGRRGV